MGSQPSHGAIPNDPAPARSRGGGPARAGFLCGLTSLAIALVAGVFASGAVPGLTSGEGMLLLLASLPVALAGLLLSALGLRTPARRRQALTGITVSLLALLPFLLGVLVIYLSWSRCQPDCL